MSIGVPATGDEKQSLLATLRRHRDAVLWKLEGLDDEQVRRPMTPTGTNLLSIVKHLASVEYGYLTEAFGRAPEPLWFTPEEDMTLGPEDTTAAIVALYGRAATSADRTVAEHGTDDLGTAWFGDTVTLRWALLRVIEDTARHAGHMDIVRELIDGATGSHRPG